MTGVHSETLLFERYIGVDYSGAALPQTPLNGLRIYMAKVESPAREIRPDANLRKNWSRAALARWLTERLCEPVRTIVGIDHGFSFPAQYFQKYKLTGDWTSFVEDFRKHWPTDEAFTVQMIRDGAAGDGAKRCGDSRWRRLCERCTGAKSVFHFDVPGSVAKSTFAGLPWLLRMRRELGARVFFWPFDGWRPPPDCSVIVEAYPKLWSGAFPRERRNEHQHDAFAVAEGLRQADAKGELAQGFAPNLTGAERKLARTEGWIFGAS